MKLITLILAFMLIGMSAVRADDSMNGASFFIQDKANFSSEKPVYVKNKLNRKSLDREIVVLSRNIKNDLIGKASNYIGATARQLGLPNTLWCADFMNMLVGGQDRRAISYTWRGNPANHGCVNCVAVTKRKGGNHVGIVKGYDNSGNPIIISGNHGRKVGVGVYAKAKVIAYRYI